MTDPNILKVIIIAYLLGSIPFGFVVGKIYGMDVRKEGSGNIGFTNVLRLVGAFPASFVLVLDAGKGWVAVYYAYSIGQEQFALLAGISAILGHLFPVFLGFKGGKGVATGFGICLFLDPLITFIALIIFLCVVYVSRYVSLGSISAAITVTVLSIVFDINFYYQVMIIPASIIVIIMHRENIKRIISKSENKVGRKEV
jgi:acyl phosphate:glycerol-3-phosphate acyltransferase